MIYVGLCAVLVGLDLASQRNWQRRSSFQEKRITNCGGSPRLLPDTCVLVLIPLVSRHVTLTTYSAFEPVSFLDPAQIFQVGGLLLFFAVDHVVTMYRHVQNKTFRALSSQTRSALYRRASSAAAAVARKPLTSILIANRGEIAL